MSLEDVLKRSGLFEAENKKEYLRRTRKRAERVYPRWDEHGYQPYNVFRAEEIVEAAETLWHRYRAADLEQHIKDHLTVLDGACTPRALAQAKRSLGEEALKKLGTSKYQDSQVHEALISELVSAGELRIGEEGLHSLLERWDAYEEYGLTLSCVIDDHIQAHLGREALGEDYVSSQWLASPDEQRHIASPLQMIHLLKMMGRRAEGANVLWWNSQRGSGWEECVMYRRVVGSERGGRDLADGDGTLHIIAPGTQQPRPRSERFSRISDWRRHAEETIGDAQERRGYDFVIISMPPSTDEAFSPVDALRSAGEYAKPSAEAYVLSDAGVSAIAKN